jgi:CheY-like chemotaxis protein
MGLSGIRVLVVEDEAFIAMLMEDYLQDIGCQVEALASRLDEALSQAETAIIDAATLDVNLAGELSYKVAKILRAREIPFIFVTGYGVIGVPEELKEVPVLSKPFTQAELATALRALLRLD